MIDVAYKFRVLVRKLNYNKTNKKNKNLTTRYFSNFFITLKKIATNGF